MFSWSTPYSRDNLEKLAVNKLVNSFSFTETKRSLTCSHDPTTGLYSTFLLILLSQVSSVAGFDDCEHMNTIDIKLSIWYNYSRISLWRVKFEESEQSEQFRSVTVSLNIPQQNKIMKQTLNSYCSEL